MWATSAQQAHQRQCHRRHVWRAPERQSKRRNRARRYAAALDGSGIVGGTIHTEDEYAELNSIVPARPPPLLLTRMMIDLSVKK
jgi:hypothetical protein